jgi:hypothetical protein
MKHQLCGSVLAVGLLLLAATAQAQAPSDPGASASSAPAPCGVDVWALQGTYAFTATAWQDLSEINPALPKGYAPVTILGAFKVDGNGDVTGWASVNTGGLRLNAELVNSRFSAPQADCRVPMSLSMKFMELGEAVFGPYDYMGVIARDGRALEIDFMMLGQGPGSHVELDHAKRISMKFN